MRERNFEDILFGVEIKKKIEIFLKPCWSDMSTIQFVTRQKRKN